MENNDIFELTLFLGLPGHELHRQNICVSEDSLKLAEESGTDLLLDVVRFAAEEALKELRESNEFGDETHRMYGRLKQLFCGGENETETN